MYFKTLENTNRNNPFSGKWTVQYLTNLVCSKASKVIAKAPGIDAISLALCLKTLTKKNREKVEYFALDMNTGFFKAVKKLCPNAEISVDRFHLVRN